MTFQALTIWPAVLFGVLAVLFLLPLRVSGGHEGVADAGRVLRSAGAATLADRRSLLAALIILFAVEFGLHLAAFTLVPRPDTIASWSIHTLEELWFWTKPLVYGWIVASAALTGAENRHNRSRRRTIMISVLTVYVISAVFNEALGYARLFAQASPSVEDWSLETWHLTWDIARTLPVIALIAILWKLPFRQQGRNVRRTPSPRLMAFPIALYIVFMAWALVGPVFRHAFYDSWGLATVIPQIGIGYHGNILVDLVRSLMLAALVPALALIWIGHVYRAVGPQADSQKPTSS